MSKEVSDRLKEAAAQLVREIDRRPSVKATFGPWFKKRLADEDWIKSPELFNFTQPLEADPLWKPEPEVLAHLEKRMAALPPGATSLDALEDTLRAFDSHTVGGIKNWFREVGGENGYWLDKRIHSLGWEMAAIATLFEWSKVSKLRRLSTGSAPDYLMEMGQLNLVVEAKMLFGRAWPLGVLQTMIRALLKIGAMAEVDSVMIIAEDLEVRTATFEEYVANLKIEPLITAIRRVAQTGLEYRISSGLLAVPRTEFATSLKTHASYRRMHTLDDWGIEFEDRSPSLDSVKASASDAWEQCEAHQEVPSGALRLNVAAIGGEAWPGHPELTSNQLLLRQWLENEVWPYHPNRVLMSSFGDILWPVWFVSPVAVENLDRVIAATAQTEG